MNDYYDINYLISESIILIHYKDIKNNTKDRRRIQNLI